MHFERRRSRQCSEPGERSPEHRPPRKARSRRLSLPRRSMLRPTASPPMIPCTSGRSALWSRSGRLGVALAKIGGYRIDAELLVLQEMSDHIDANAVDAALEPEPAHIVNGAARLRVAPSRERVAKVLNVIP